jgi:chromosome partitioning protein
VKKDVFAHAPESRGAQDYEALLDELVATGFVEPRNQEAPAPAEDPRLNSVLREAPALS